MISYKGALSLQHEDVHKSPSKGVIVVDVVAMNVHYSSGSYHDNSLECMPSLVEVSLVDEVS